MIFTNPQWRSYVTSVSNRGLLKRHLDPDVLTAARRNGRLQLRLLSRYGSVRRLLDFGCGSGALVAEARLAGIDAVGLDLNQGQVEAANAHWKFDALRSVDLDVFVETRPEPFDGIVSNQVFEHLQSPLVTGLKLVSLLKPGGLIYLDVPYVYQPGEWLSRGKTLDPSSHWCHFSLRTLSGLVERMGCRVVFKSAAPALVRVWQGLGMGTTAAESLGIICKTVLPPVGTGACVIGRRDSGM
jgi:SAM-dependent methyltransferase